MFFECYIRIHYLDAAAMFAREALMLAKGLSIPSALASLTSALSFTAAFVSPRGESHDLWLIVASATGVFAVLCSLSLVWALAHAFFCWRHSRKAAVQIFHFLRQASEPSRKRIRDLLDQNLRVTEQWGYIIEMKH